MDATTTLATVGISAGTITTFLNTLFNQAINIMIYTFQMVWPYLLVLGIIGVVIGIAYGALHLTRRA